MADPAQNNLTQRLAMAHPLASEPETNNAQEAAAAAANQVQEVLPVFADDQEMVVPQQLDQGTRVQPLTMIPQGNAPPAIPPGQRVQRTTASGPTTTRTPRLPILQQETAPTAVAPLMPPDGAAPQAPLAHFGAAQQVPLAPILAADMTANTVAPVQQARGRGVAQMPPPAAGAQGVLHAGPGPNNIPIPHAMPPAQQVHLPFNVQRPQQMIMPALQHATFASFFQDDSKDPFRTRYAAVLSRFDPMTNNPLASDALLDLAVGNPSVPSTYMCCASIHGTKPRIYVLHTLSKYVPSFDGRPTPWDNRIFGFLGDVMSDSALTIAIPNTSFNIVQCTTYTNARLSNELVRIGDNDLLPRLNAGAQDTVLVQTRSLMYLPSKYAPLVLSNRGYGVKEFWNILAPALQADNLLQHASPIINWLKASWHTTGANNRGAPVTLLAISSPFIDQDLAAHRNSLLHNFLPSLHNHHDPGLNAALIQMANAVSSQAAEAQTARLAKEIERDRPPMPSQKFGVLFNTLKLLLNVADENDLPEIWFTLAAASKKQEFSVIRDALDAFSRTPQAYTTAAPVPTPKLVSDLTTITFAADHPDDLKTGIQPFVVMDGSEEYRHAAQDLARNYTLLSEQNLSLQFSDLTQLKLPKDLRAHPITYFELEKSLGLFGNLLHVILGATHPLSTHYKLFWDTFQRQFRTQLHFEIDTRRLIKPVHILRNIQLICFHWFQSQKANMTPSVPQFLDILTRISLSTYHNPNLPSALYQLIAPKPSQKYFVPDGTKTAIDEDVGTAATGISTLTSGSGLLSNLGGGKSIGSSRTGTFIKNAAVDSSLQSLLPAGLKISDLVGSDSAPVGDDNNPICLSFHIRGGCFSNCRRKENHAKTLSPAEKQKLSNWIVDQTTKLKAKFAAG